ncbi:hypothetical protein ACVWY5_001119 [Bradyrhizobium sp. USDA 3256]
MSDIAPSRREDDRPDFVLDRRTAPGTVAAARRELSY